MLDFDHRRSPYMGSLRGLAAVLRQQNSHSALVLVISGRRRAALQGYLDVIEADYLMCDLDKYLRQAGSYRKPHASVMPRLNRLSWRDDRAVLLRSSRLGLAIQVEVAA